MRGDQGGVKGEVVDVLRGEEGQGIYPGTESYLHIHPGLHPAVNEHSHL